MIEFVSYDGKWPNLCSGVLVLKVNEKIYTFPKHSLRSGGSVNWKRGKITDGYWSIGEWPQEFPEELREEALEVINVNVKHGCCGGCI